MQISKRLLASSGMEVTTVGFGAWAIGGGGWSFGWGLQDDKASEETIHHALELGINWIDTAAVYGLGHSEELVGRVVRSLPQSERPVVFTKCGRSEPSHSRRMDARLIEEGKVRNSHKVEQTQ